MSTRAVIRGAGLYKNSDMDQITALAMSSISALRVKKIDLYDGKPGLPLPEIVYTDKIIHAIPVFKYYDVDVLMERDPNNIFKRHKVVGILHSTRRNEETKLNIRGTRTFSRNKAISLCMEQACEDLFEY
ncbi:hypothetical protein [Glaciecola petra]|uniref:Uncharacterized protein n=1 Tax=Glaciecola petra TaxID=3075602 RepID=A0ABU2ZVI9_9ALTE|nr:hypothetical protein [Aestuariibacter sp. P117]MDT0596048.1 hypothetical protein [Aestuariibacter sp. P117]